MSDQPPVQTDTTTDNLIPQGALTHVDVEAHAVLQVTKMAEFLVTNFPNEIALTNRQQPETPVDTAIRLLTSLAAKAPYSALERCKDVTCNKPLGHADIHGWIQAD